MTSRGQLRIYLGSERAAAPRHREYTGALGGPDIEIYARTTTFAIMQSIRLDRGPSGGVHLRPQRTNPISRAGTVRRDVDGYR